MKRPTLFAFACLCTLALSGITLSSFAPNSQPQYGKCGYYADSFHGRPTSSGEKYNKNALTCSHKTLPFGTKVRITRLDNKKSVIARVNDRGPFIEGYIVDVSRAAAEELDLIKAGTARVKVEVVESAQSALANDAEFIADAGATTRLIAARPATYSQEETSAKGAAASSNLYKVDIKPSAKIGFGIQISTLSDANNVLPIINKLQSQWPGKVLVNVVKDDLGEATYKIIVGPYAERNTAETQQKAVAKKGYKKTIIVDLEEI